MDFKPFEGRSDDGVVLTVIHPGTGKPTDAQITLAGTDSKVWRKAVKELNLRSIQSAKKGEDVLGQALSVIDESKPGLLASVTLRWENVQLNGEELACTSENAEKLYTDYSWLLEQVDQFVGDRANFFRSVDAPAPAGD